MQQVIDYIDAHLDEDDLSLAQLSDIAALSKFHFHRQFSAFFALSVYSYIQTSRLKRASFELAYRSDKSVINIALDSGYRSPESFARAFKLYAQQTPSNFRKQPLWQPWQQANHPIHLARSMRVMSNSPLDQVKIIDVPATKIAVLAHHGDPILLGDSIRTFIAWRKQHHLPPARNATYNLLYNDPKTTPAADFRLDLCVATDIAISPNDAGIIAGLIPTGRCATLRHVGTEESLVATFTALYRDWLPDSGEQLRDFPLYLQRVAFFPDVAENDAITDIFLPLQ
jgi:AraC family transcriptional regulator